MSFGLVLLGMLVWLFLCCAAWVAGSSAWEAKRSVPAFFWTAVGWALLVFPYDYAWSNGGITSGGKVIVLVLHLPLVLCIVLAFYCAVTRFKISE